jgi:hypothetical protein
MTMRAPTTPGRLLSNILRPIVRLAIHVGVGYPEMAAAMRRQFVDVARIEYRDGDKELSESRVSVLTGIARADLRRRRIEEEGGSSPLSLSHRIALRWTQRPYLDADGRPQPLPRLASQAKRGRSFEDLVADVHTDIRARALLDDWLSRGFATLDDQDRVHFDSQRFSREAGDDVLLHNAAHTIHDAAAAVVDGLVSRQPGNFSNMAFFENLTEDQVVELRQHAAELGHTAVYGANDKGESFDRSNPGTMRVTFGIFFRQVDQAREPAILPEPE